MKITIGKFDSATNSVPVVFEHRDVRHERSVNACFNDKGRYDPKATAQRVDEVALGFEQKVNLGVVTNPPPAPDPQEVAPD